MNKQAFLHITDSQYCFPSDSNEMVLRLRTARDDVKEVFLLYESKYKIAERQKKVPMEKAYSTEDFDFYEIRLKLRDTRLAYVFYVSDGNGWYYFSEDGLTETYDFSLAYYNFFQYVYINEADIVRTVPWMETAVFYQIFVDRFFRGDYAKDDAYIDMAWNDIPRYYNHAGGDLRGVIKKLSYIKSVGCNCIYLTPVFTSVSNHKYDISDYYTVDPQFGTNEDLKELVAKAHGKGMRIVLDAVFNHCSENHAFFRDCIEKGKASPYWDWFIIKDEPVCRKPANYETFAACEYMPKWNTSNPKVQKYLIDIAVYYIREYDIDGWRLDVSDEISREFWREFRKAVKGAKNDAVIIGENWHDAYQNLRGDQYDSIMNYAFTKVILDYLVFGTKDADGAARKMNELLMRNKDAVNHMMLNLLGCHDTHRILTLLKGDEAKLKQAFALLYFYPGAPCVYYGDELMMEGGFDPDCRRGMMWERVGNDLRPYLKALADIRKKAKLNKGDCRIFALNDVLVLENKKGRHVTRLYVNHSGADQTVCVAQESVIVKSGGVCVTRDGEKMYLVKTL